LKATPFTGRFMPYGWGGLPNPLSAAWMAYSQMLGEFSTELANTINGFTHDVQRLRVWSEVVAPLSDKQKLNATHEFIDTLATNAVNLPYVIRSRFAFATAHLCHQANQTRDFSGWNDDLPLDGEIWLNTADQYGKGWASYVPLKRRLEAIGAKAFKDATGDFRNAYNHRFSPRFVVGMTGLVTRIVDKDTGGVCYGFGGREPLDLAAVADLLAEERDRCYAAFTTFQALVGEQVAAIAAHERSIQT
jgi:hypothetical protein